MTPESKARLQEQLEQFCVQLGGSVQRLPHSQFLEVRTSEGKEISGGFKLEVAPFTFADIGVDYERKILWLGTEAEGPLVPSAAEIGHELGHIFASEVEPEFSDEKDFMGWEYALAKKFGYEEQFLEFMQTYGFDEEFEGERFFEFSELSRRKQLRFLQKMLEEAVENGLVSPEGEPLAIR